MRIGFVGVGTMGKGMVRNLLKAGHSVVGYDVNQAAVDEVVPDGAQKAATAAAAVAGADLVFTSLPSPAALRDVVGDILPACKAGAYICDMSTVDPGITQELHAVAATRGVRTLDCPVSGGPHGAASATLTIMVGGAQADYEAVLPVLRVLGKNIVYCGGIGMGQTAKLCNNIIGAAHVAILSEALLTGVKAGLDLDVLVSVIRTSSGGSWMLENFAMHTILRENYAQRFTLDLMYKDLTLYMATAQAMKVPTVMSSPVFQLYTAAKVAEDGKQDHTIIARVMERLAGAQIGRLPEDYK